MLEIMKPCFDVMNRGFSACVNQFDIPFPFSMFSEHAGRRKADLNFNRTIRLINDFSICMSKFLLHVLKDKLDYRVNIHCHQSNFSLIRKTFCH